MSRRKKVLIGGAVAVVVVAGGAAAWVLTHSGGDVFNPKIAFQDEPTVTPAPATPEPTKKGKVDRLRNFVWATYGYSPDRRHYLAASAAVRPPFRWRWSYDGHSLLEFTPSMAQGKLFVIRNDGMTVALDKKTGKVRWKRSAGALAAATPAYGGGLVYAPVLNRAPGQPGAITAFRAKNGHKVWAKALPSRTESSPVYAAGRVYLGSEGGTVYGLRASNGHVIWTFHASGAVKGGLALSQGNLYFGDYSGRVYALRASNGHQVWSTGTSGSLFGLRSGQFYSSPAVAYGRVYIGNTDGRMYSFSASSGKLAWTKGTGSYVYASPAVAQVPGGKPTVYFGSYDGRFYACDARTGAVRWTHTDGGRISGSATVIGSIVYYANLGLKATLGLNARTGKVVYRRHAGSFNPAISDGRDIFLIASDSITSFRPTRVVAQERRQKSKRSSRRKSGSGRSGK